MQAVYIKDHPGAPKVTWEISPGDYVGYLTDRATKAPYKHDAQLAETFPQIKNNGQVSEPMLHCVAYEDAEYISVLGVGHLSKNAKGEFARTAFAIRFKPDAAAGANTFITALRKNPQDILTHAFNNLFKKHGVPDQSPRPNKAIEFVTPGPIAPALKMQFRDLRAPK